MGKRGKSQKKDNRNPKKSRSRDEFNDEPEDMDDEIDAFHKQRDIVPLHINDGVGQSSEDDEEPVFDDEDINGGGDDDDDDDDTGLAAKIVKQQKFLRAKFGGFDDEMLDEEEEEEDDEEKRVVWSGKYHDGDNGDFELQSSDDEAPKEEEEEVLRILREKSKSLTNEDFGIQDDSEDEGDRELTLGELSVKGNMVVQVPSSKEVVDDMGTSFEEVKKDLNAVSKEEQMDVVYSSAPELVGLLSELNDALEQLESRVNPLLNKVKEDGVMLEGGMRYLEVKQLILLSYCQAITFYLLLKSEGQPVRDHPVIACLVEIKGLLDKMKQLDGNLPSELDEILKENPSTETVENPVTEDSAPALASDSVTNSHDSSLVLADINKLAEPCDTNELAKLDLLGDHEVKEGKRKHKNDQLGIKSMEMKKVRATLEEKLKQKGVFSSLVPKSDKAQKHPKPLNRQLETYDDFDDDAINVEKGNHASSNGHTSLLGSSKLSQLVTFKPNKPKVISGDDDLPKRDDIGERRRKHELRVLAGARVKSEDDGTPGAGGASDMDEDGGKVDSEEDLYEQVRKQRAVKLAAKAVTIRTPAAPSLPEIVDGKRQIDYQIAKNKGLTPKRKKQDKNPRKKYRTKHDKAQKRRKGQVREIKKPIGPYGGEISGINAGVSRSIRLF